MKWFLQTRVRIVQNHKEHFEKYDFPIEDVREVRMDGIFITIHLYNGKIHTCGNITVVCEGPRI